MQRRRLRRFGLTYDMQRFREFMNASRLVKLWLFPKSFPVLIGFGQHIIWRFSSATFTNSWFLLIPLALIRRGQPDQMIYLQLNLFDTLRHGVWMHPAWKINTYFTWDSSAAWYISASRYIPIKYLSQVNSGPEFLALDVTQTLGSGELRYHVGLSFLWMIWVLPIFSPRIWYPVLLIRLIFLGAKENKTGHWSLYSLLKSIS